MSRTALIVIDPFARAPVKLAGVVPGGLARVREDDLAQASGEGLGSGEAGLGGKHRE